MGRRGKGTKGRRGIGQREDYYEKGKIRAKGRLGQREDYGQRED